MCKLWKRRIPNGTYGAVGGRPSNNGRAPTDFKTEHGRTTDLPFPGLSNGGYDIADILVDFLPPYFRIEKHLRPGCENSQKRE
jgi:hypothetical protein